MRALLLITFLLAACASPDPDAPATPDPVGPTRPEAPSVPEEPVSDDPASPEPPLSLAEILARLDAGGDQSALTQELAEAGEVVVTTEENRHDRGQIDTVRTIRYPGLEIEAYTVRDGPTFVREVRVTGGDFTSADGLGVGASREIVEGLFGEPVRTRGERIIYETEDSPAPTTLEVVYDPEGNAERLVWRPYVD